MNKLYVLTGVPGSGKSTWASKMSGCKVVSTDNIRKEIFGNESTQYTDELVEKLSSEKDLDERSKRRITNKFIFDTAFSEALSALTDGDVIFDATSSTVRNRKEIIDRFRDKAKIVSVFLTTPLNVCLERNSQRERRVPENIIRSMYERLEIPSLEEGFSQIILA